MPLNSLETRRAGLIGQAGTSCHMQPVVLRSRGGCQIMDGEAVGRNGYEVSQARMGTRGMSGGRKGRG